MNKPLLVGIVGPTASGKTDLSIRIAREIPVTIISADSRQVFKYLDIGTAKPTPEQRSLAPHRCIDIVEPTDEYNAGQFGEEALKEVRQAVDDGTMPLVVGGSGLYIRALVDGITMLPGKDDEIRRTLQERFDEEGEEGLRNELEKVDPAASVGIERGKPRRLIRALEVYYLTGTPLTEHHERIAVDRPFERLIFGLSVPRVELYKRIDERANEMVGEGLLVEVEGLLGMGVPRTAQSLNTVGYKEAVQRIDGEISEERMIGLMQQMTRRFAKRQYTWFRAEQPIQWIEAPDARSVDAIAEEILEKIEQAQKN